jgi:hypothetical protein
MSRNNSNNSNSNNSNNKSVKKGYVEQDYNQFTNGIRYFGNITGTRGFSNYLNYIPRTIVQGVNYGTKKMYNFISKNTNQTIPSTQKKYKKSKSRRPQQTTITKYQHRDKSPQPTPKPIIHSQNRSRGSPQKKTDHNSLSEIKIRKSGLTSRIALINKLKQIREIREIPLYIDNNGTYYLFIPNKENKLIFTKQPPINIYPFTFWNTNETKENYETKIKKIYDQYKENFASNNKINLEQKYKVALDYAAEKEKNEPYMDVTHFK